MLGTRITRSTHVRRLALHALCVATFLCAGWACVGPTVDDDDLDFVAMVADSPARDVGASSKAHWPQTGVPTGRLHCENPRRGATGVGAASFRRRGTSLPRVALCRSNR